MWQNVKRSKKRDCLCKTQNVCFPFSSYKVAFLLISEKGFVLWSNSTSAVHIKQLSIPCCGDAATSHVDLRCPVVLATACKKKMKTKRSSKTWPPARADRVFLSRKNVEMQDGSLGWKAAVLLKCPWESCQISTWCLALKISHCAVQSTIQG